MYETAMRTIASSYPCCPRRKVRFSFYRALPQERHARACPDCGAKWDVLRVNRREGAGLIIDSLTWERRPRS